MLTPKKIIDFLTMLDDFDSVSIEENQNGENVTLNAIKAANSGNNCLHFQIVHNNHRIVIQTYKYIYIPSKPIDIVQGKPEMEDKFIDFIDFLNDSRDDFSDRVLNHLFVLYCGIWQKCSAFYPTEMDCYICEFGINTNIIYDNQNSQWIINANNASLSEINLVICFISMINILCQ